MTFAIAFGYFVYAVVFAYLVGTAAMLVSMLLELRQRKLVESAARNEATAHIVKQAATCDRGGFASYQTDAAAANELLKMVA